MISRCIVSHNHTRSPAEELGESLSHKLSPKLSLYIVHIAEQQALKSLDKPSIRNHFHIITSHIYNGH